MIKMGTFGLREVRWFAHNYTASRSGARITLSLSFSKAHSILYIIRLCILRKVPERFSLANLEVIEAEKSFKRLLISELVTLLKTPQLGLNYPRRLD